MSVLQPLSIAFGLLSRLPVKHHAIAEAELARAIPWFPVVGAALGLALAGTELLLRGHLSPALLAVALVALLAALSGGLHLDGLADVFDALGGGRGDRDRMLAIMRDSRIGAHGAAALSLLLAAKIFAIIEILEQGSSWPLFAFPILARWAVIPLLLFFPYARAEGLGRPFNTHGRPLHFLWATCLTAAVLAWVGPHVLMPSAVALVVALGVGVWLKRRLGGLTGDVYGLAIELSELAFLIVVGLEDHG